MRLVALWYDCNTLLDVVPEQHLQKKTTLSFHFTNVGMSDHILRTTITNLRRALFVLLCDFCYFGVLQDPVWVPVSI